MDIKKTFIGSRMNKALDERLIPNGEYTDALNIRISSDEDGEAGSVENAKGNEEITTLMYQGQELLNAVCIGTIADDSKETIYWFVTSPTVDMIVSFNVSNSVLKYHVVSETVLNFNELFPINGVNLIDNLLFFTDNLNPPRRINVDRTYNNVTEDDISVIVKPPRRAPEISTINNLSQENYIEDKFVSFCYRYKYKDGEYSALSEFTQPAFVPSRFRIDYGSFDNLGMLNSVNNVNVTVDSGPNNVVGFDVCFKLSTSNVVNVIKRFDKSELGISDNSTYSFDFSNKSIYTTLQQSELLRLYDNVPRLAKSQTFMGNRLFYGNYVDGYNIDKTIQYKLELISEDIESINLEAGLSNGVNYTINSSTSIANSKIDIDLSGIDLEIGSVLYIDFNLEHDSFEGDASYNDGVNMVFNDFNYNFSFVLPESYNTVQELSNSQDFIDYIKTNLPFNQSNNGNSLTDIFNSSLVVKNGWKIIGTGVTSDNGDFEISVNNNILSIQIPAIKFTDIDTETLFAYEYLYNTNASASFSNISDLKSLHSNRGYEFGIVYMDDYKRASTVLVSDNYSVFVQANLSLSKNSVRATIKSKAPSWATNYRFAFKSNKQGYETIYSNIYYQDPRDGAWWVKLDGANQTKAKVGDTLIVKRDSLSILNTVVKTTIIDIKTQEEDFISLNKVPTNQNEDLIELQGVYMKLIPSNFDLEYSESNFISYGSKKEEARGFDFSTALQSILIGNFLGPTSGLSFAGSVLTANNGGKPRLGYPMYYTDENSNTIEYAVPAGSVVRFYFNAWRFGRKRGGCRSRYWKFDREFVATRDYDNMYNFILGENINFEEPTNNPEVESSDDTPTLEFISTRDSVYPTPQNAVHKLKYMDVDGKPYLVFQSGDNRCGGKRSYVEMNIEVNLSGSQLIFETEPLDSNDEIFYESSDSFDIVNGNHYGNVQNQTDLQDCIVDLDFFDCYSFGNGAESYKILDKISKPELSLGARVTAVSNQEYKEAHRYSDVTYSGVYNEETNINNLNVFNLGLVNYRLLERLFGPINRMHGRQTDIMVLQEDKISYLLAGKNLLSDAAGGSTLTSVPEVLGTQISRIEEFGISDDADSFDSFGYDIFFTDTKRGAVINIKGGSAQSDQLNVISMFGMRTWFRDRFIENQNTFKIGAYDPYHQEYVLHISDIEKIVEPDTIECGVRIKGKGNYKNETINTSTAIGSVDVDYTVSQSTNIKITYDNNLLVNQNVTGTGTLTFSKNLQSENKYAVEITTVGDWEVNFGCVESEPLTIIKLVSGDINQEGLLTQQNHFWFNADQTSPESAQDVVEMQQEPVSLYRIEDGFESEGYFPAALSTVTMRGVSTINRQYNITNDKMLYLISDTLYNDIGDILPLATEIQNVLIQGGTVTRSFLYDNPNNFRYLYMIWRYTTPDGIITNTAPFAYNNIYNTERNVAVFITLTGFDPDGDALTFSVVTNPSHGTLSGTAPNLTYTPDLNYTGTDSFTFKVNDGTVDSNIATVSIVVSEPPSLTAFSVTINGDINEGNSCVSMSALAPRFHDGAGAYPSVGDFIYESTSGGNYQLFDGQDLWYRMDNNEIIRIQTSPMGRVIQKSTCL